MTQIDEEEQNEIKTGSTPLWKGSRTEVGDEHRPLPDPVLDTPDPMQQPRDTPSSEYRDPRHRGQSAKCGSQGQNPRLPGHGRGLRHRTTG